MCYKRFRGVHKNITSLRRLMGKARGVYMKIGSPHGRRLYNLHKILSYEVSLDVWICDFLVVRLLTPRKRVMKIWGILEIHIEQKFIYGMWGGSVTSIRSLRGSCVRRIRNIYKKPESFLVNIGEKLWDVWVKHKTKQMRLCKIKTHRRHLYARLVHLKGININIKRLRRTLGACI